MNVSANMTSGTAVSGSGGGGGNAIQEEFSAAMRRLSVAPVNRSMVNQGRNSSWRQGSIPWFRNSALTHDDDDRGYGGWHSLFPTQPLQQAQYIFPSALCAATVLLIHLLDDTAVNDQGIAVNTIAEYCVFQCLLEDTTLFMRFILERLTRTHHKGELIFVLRKMIQRLPGLPMQSAHTIFNNLVGYIMFHVRASSYVAPEAIACALSVLHLSTLLLTANLPCAKQFNVFDNDIGVAQLVRLQDDNKDYQFEDILRDALESNGIPADQSHLYFLFDDRSNVIRNNSHYIRDFYPFKRNHNPKLRLRQLDTQEGLYLLQQNALNLKFQEIGKVLFTTTVLQNTPSAQVCQLIAMLLGKPSKQMTEYELALIHVFNLACLRNSTCDSEVNI
ncbi:hypothetical protein P879_07926 [Paragonimus westermani]|uniref:Protein UNC80 C-terminal domain-containing protein n=1 Tax=Paragonimus westermani TaxID=34504 RepID=A0A8T0DBR5_9TREM|nr:hypothetical protein P879_07926 [Paragonimus westermani]